DVYKRQAKILIFDPYEDWKGALDFLGGNYMKFRRELRRDKSVQDLSAFGMPIIFSLSGFKRRLVPYDLKNGKKRLSERWASPVIFKVIKSKNNKYFPVVISLKPGGVKFFGEEKKEKKKENRKVEKTEEIKRDKLNEEKKESWKVEKEKIEKINTNILNDFLEFLKKERKWEELNI
ncbi:MAG: hypothetical protein N2254_09990, partial [bacterium]|nr:hypothetical protein [bacterium]